MALRAHTRGGPDQLVYEQAPIPVPQRGEALVAVHAAAITFAELAARPRSVPHEAAATLPLAALTAWQALVDYAALEAGERVLVHGGAGG